MIYLKAFILSIVEVFSEFIPVSSTAHLLIVGRFLNFDNNDGQLFSVAIQFGAILAVFVVYFPKIHRVIVTLNKKESKDFILKFILAFLPIAIVGFAIYKYVKAVLSTEFVIALSLIFGGIIILIVDKMKIKEKFKSVEEVDNGTAVKIGFYQALSLIAGMSRSGTTIVGGLLSGLSRKTAVEFSFLLALPTIFCATLYDVYKNYQSLNSENIYIILFGFFISFIASLFIVRGFLNYISKHNLDFFGWYRIGLGFFLLALIAFGFL